MSFAMGVLISISEFLPSLSVLYHSLFRKSTAFSAVLLVIADLVPKTTCFIVQFCALLRPGEERSRTDNPPGGKRLECLFAS